MVDEDISYRNFPPRSGTTPEPAPQPGLTCLLESRRFPPVHIYLFAGLVFLQKENAISAIESIFGSQAAQLGFLVFILYAARSPLLSTPTPRNSHISHAKKTLNPVYLTVYLKRKSKRNKSNYKSNSRNSFHCSSNSFTIHSVRQPMSFSTCARKRRDPRCSAGWRRQYPSRDLSELFQGTVYKRGGEGSKVHRCRRWQTIKQAFSTVSFDMASPITMARCDAIVFCSISSIRLTGN